jgi:hypothetical protein
VVAVGAGGLAGLMSSRDSLAAAAAQPDALSAVISAEIKAAIKEMTQRPGPGARRFAGALRVFAANARAHGVDASVAEQYRNLVKAQGRDAVLLSEPDWTTVREQARQLGIERFTPSPVNMAARSKALDALLAGQFTAFLAQAADEVDAVSHRLDERAVPGLRPVVYGDAACIRTMQMEGWADTAMKITCAAAGIFVIEFPVCAEAIGVFIGIWSVNEYNGCHG